MTINRENVMEQFAAYTRNYDSNDPKIALKIRHTYRVAEHCEEIARAIGMNDEDIEIAWLLGMLHDIGRFEQVKRYGTFYDNQSVDHAEFGADLLFGEDNLIRTYVEDSSCDDVIETAVRQHNKLRISDDVTGKTFAFCNILRDADKVDIFRVNVETPPEDIYNVSPEELRNSAVSEAVMNEVRKHHVVPRGIPRTPADRILTHIALAFELVYPISYEIAEKEGYLDKLLHFESYNDITRAALAETEQELKKWKEEYDKQS